MSKYYFNHKGQHHPLPLGRLMGEIKQRISNVTRDTRLSCNIVALMYKETAQKVDLSVKQTLQALNE